MGSIWAATRPRRTRPPLVGELDVDVAIIGAGITGLTAALLLAKAGRSVAVIEARAVGAGDSGRSTGNLYQTVTGGLGTLGDRWGADTARAIVASRGEAITWIEQQARAMGPGSGFRRCPMYQYPLSRDAEPAILRELQALRAAGLDGQLASEVPTGLPGAKGAVLLLPAQAQFHPIGYLHGLAEQAEHAGARLFEHSPAFELDLEAGVVRTPTGTITGHHIVLATHSPLGFHLVQAGMAVRREYGLAFREQTVPPGIFWAQGHPRLSVRGFETNGEHYLVCIGEHHETGRHDAAAALVQLERAAQQYLAVDSPVQRWSAQHFHSPDGLPYIGRDESGAYIATGFSTDGLVYGTIAAHIIADQIIGTQNRWNSLYLAKRFEPVKAARNTVRTNVDVAKAFLHDYLTQREAQPLDRLSPGQGALVQLPHERVAAYRDPHGAFHAVSRVCTHMKCIVHWNPVEQSWDCPCHGSRFSVDGRVLQGPAIAPLADRLPALLQQLE